MHIIYMHNEFERIKSSLDKIIEQFEEVPEHEIEKLKILLQEGILLKGLEINKKLNTLQDKYAVKRRAGSI
jgi:hypothetical protein